MIRRHHALEEFELRELSKPLSLSKKLRLFEEMFQHAVEMGVFENANPLAGIEDDIERTKKIHAVRSGAGSPRQRVR